MLTDACRVASRCFRAGDWHYSAFQADWPHAAPMYNNYKEACAVANVVARWVPMWVGRTVVVHRDSAVTKATLNEGRSKNAYIDDVLRLICTKQFPTILSCVQFTCQVVSVAFHTLFPGSTSLFQKKDSLAYSHTGTTAVGHYPPSRHTRRNHHTFSCESSQGLGDRSGKF